jgi:hypothetical protein
MSVSGDFGAGPHGRDSSRTHRHGQLASATPESSPEEYPDVFFARSSPSRQASQEALQRIRQEEAA